MTTPPEQPFRGAEYPPLEQSATAGGSVRAGRLSHAAIRRCRRRSYPAAATAGYPGYNPYDPYRQGKPPGTNGKAIAALVISLGGAGVLRASVDLAADHLGVIAMRDTKRTGQDGYGIALAGTIIGAIPILLWVLYLVFFVVIFASGFQWAP